MGIFSLTSKRASVTLVFLIVSILVISSGAVIMYEIRKTNGGEIGTGLVLLDEVQHIEEEQEVDNSFSFTIDKKEVSKSSSKSSRSKKTSEDDLELLSFNLENENLEEDFTNLSNQIFSRNGTDYILRDGKEYKLASSDAKSSAISFNPPLPSSVCVGASGNEKIDIGIQGGFYPSSNDETFGYCLDLTETKYISATLTLRIKEYDFWSSDDLIATKYLTVYISCAEFVAGEGYVSYSEIFEDIDLSLQFYGVEDPNNIEVYGLVELTSYYLRNLGYSTSNYKVNKEQDCQCISGSCCDLRSRPYEYKPYGSQPTDKTDSYYCEGDPSPTGTSYAKKRDYYCTGSSSSYTWTTSTTDTCRTCAYCEAGYRYCSLYYQNEYCGTKDCDYLDTTCRNYHDLDKGCSGGGTCSSPSCNSYTNTDPGTSCGTNKECDGYGNCVSADIACSSDSDCGTDGWVGSSFCSADDVYQKYRTYTCHNSGTSSSYCSDSDTDEKKEECGSAGCSNGQCNEIECPDSVCGGYCGNYATYPNWRFYNSNDGTQNYYFCSGDCKYNFAEYCSQGCENGECNSETCTPHSTYSCYSNDVYWYDSCGDREEKKTECGTSGYTGSNYCSNNDVYRAYITKGCSGSSCTSSTSSIKQEECGTSGYTGTNYCYNNNVYRDYVTRGCSGSSCTSSTSGIKQEECGSTSCSSWGANYCKGDDVYHKRTCYYGGCSNDICYNNLITDEQKVQDCANGCTENRCKVEVCETVCSPTKCYEYCVWQ